MRFLSYVRVTFALGAVMLAAGCNSAASGPSAVLTGDQFAQLYHDEHNVTDVWYMGSDDKYNYFCMEHWTFKADGSDATLDSRKFCQVSVTDFGVRQPFTLTHNEQQWRLLRPKGGGRPAAA